jgi:hypothetical protein
MSDQRKKQSKFSQFLPMIVMVLVGFLCGFFFSDLLGDIFDPDWGLGKTLGIFAGVVLVLIAGVIFQVIVHEAGHLIFGLLSGYRFSSFRIFSWMWIDTGEGIRFKRFSLAGTDGQCLLVPPDPVNGQFPVTLYHLGGSLLNLLVGVLFLVLYVLLGNFPIASTLMLWISAFGFIMGLVNGIPMRTNLVDNDGYNAFSMSKNPKSMRALWLQLKINEQTAKGVRLKDMPEDWFAVPSDKDMENSLVAALGVFACNRLMDAQKFQEADRLMAHLLESPTGMPGIYKNLLICDRIYIELLGENRPDVLEPMLTKQQKKFMKAMKSFPSVLRTEFALAWLSQKNAGRALSLQAQFNKIAKTYPHPQEIQAEQALIDLAKNKE